MAEDGATGAAPPFLATPEEGSPVAAAPAPRPVVLSIADERIDDAPLPVPVPAAAPTAAVSGEALPAPAPAPAPPPPPAQQAAPPPLPALAEPVEWLAARGGGTARVRLDPPSLGEVELEVRLRGRSIELTLRTHGEAAQALLAGERAALGQILAGRELRLDAFVVTHEAGSPSQEAGRDAGARDGGSRDPVPQRAAPSEPAPGSQGSRAVDRAPPAGAVVGRLDVRI